MSVSRETLRQYHSPARGMFHVKHLAHPTIATGDQFADYAAQHGCVLSAAQTERITALAQWLAQRAPPLGLSRYRHFPAVLTAALSPPLALLDLLDIRAVHQVMDLGAGSGALGFTLALAQPHLSVDLIERRRKAVTFLELTTQHLNIANIRVILGDARDLSPSHNESYDLVCFRALTSGSAALELAWPFARSDGYVAAWHQAGDAAFDRPPLPLQRTSTAQTLVPGLVVSLYRRSAAL